MFGKEVLNTPLQIKQLLARPRRAVVGGPVLVVSILVVVQ
jgi:hypothetical protein